MNKINYDPALEAPLAQEQPSSQQPKCLNCQEFIQPGQNSAVPIYLKQANNLLYFEAKDAPPELQHTYFQISSCQHKYHLKCLLDYYLKSQTKTAAQSYMFRHRAEYLCILCK